MCLLVLVACCGLVIAALAVACRAAAGWRRRLRIVRTDDGRERVLVWAEEIMLSGFRWPVPDVPDRIVVMAGPCVDLTTSLLEVEGRASQLRSWYKSDRAEPIPTGTSAFDHWYFGGDDLTYREPTVDLDDVERADAAARYFRDLHAHFLARAREGEERR